MINKEYWNVKEAKKSELKKSLLGFTIFCIVFIFLLYLMRSHIYIISLIVICGIIWDLYGIYKKHLKIISYPVMRTQNDLLVCDYEQKIVSRNQICKITWIVSKNRIVISYRIPDFLKSTLEKSDNIDVKLIEDKKNFIQELKNMCEKKEIPFIVVKKQPWYHIWIIY